MRSVLVILFLALLILTPPVASQAESDAELLDPPNDVDFAGTSDPGVYSVADITRIAIRETPAELIWTIAMPEMGQEMFRRHPPSLFTDFSIDGSPYGLSMATGIDSDTLGAWVARVYDRSSGETVKIADVPLRMDKRVAEFTVTMDRRLFGDKLLEGAPLHDIWVTSVLALDDQVRFEDRAPDTGTWDALVVQHGARQEASIKLSTPQAFPASNGEVGLYLYEVTARNEGKAGRFSFEAMGLPAGWSAGLPPPTRLEAGQSAAFLLPVQTAFTHSHGSVFSFDLRMVDVDAKENAARLQLGLNYLPVPQPAGHHSTVYLHSRDRSGELLNAAFGPAYVVSDTNTFQDAFLNVLQEDGEDDQVAVEAEPCPSTPLTTPTTSSYCWEARLHPELAMGLDFDLTRPGRYAVPVSSATLHPQAVLSGSIAYAVGDGELALATLQPSAPADLVADTVVFEGLLEPTPESDIVPPREDADLVVHLRLDSLGDNPEGIGPHRNPTLMPGGVMDLPLLDFEPAVQALPQANGLTLSVDAQSGVNPGEETVLTVRLANDGEQPLRMALSAAARPTEWVDQVPQQGFTLRPGAANSRDVVVRVPSDALPGQAIDVVVIAQDVDDLSRQVFARTRLYVDTTTDWPDAKVAPEATKAAETPFGAFVGFLALGISLLARKR